MLKFAVEFHLISMVYMVPVVFLGMYKFNLKKLKSKEVSHLELFTTCLLLSVTPGINIAIGARNFMYLLMGTSKSDETK